MAPNGAGRIFVPANPDLADILGDTDFDFEKFYFSDCFGSQISGLGPAWAQLGHRLGPAWARLGPGLGPPTWARLGPTVTCRVCCEMYRDFANFSMEAD